MAKISTLIDDFQDGVIDASKWDVSGTVTESGGRARLTPTSSFSVLITDLPDNWDLTNSQFVAHVPQVTSNGSSGTLQCGMQIFKDTNNWVAIRKVGNNLQAARKVAGVEFIDTVTPYNGVTHIFWRIRCDSSNIYWETTSNPIGYFIQHTMSLGSLGFSLTNLGVQFFAGWSSGSEPFPGVMAIEAVNPGLPLVLEGLSTSTGSLDIGIAGPVQIVFAGDSTSTGSLTLITVSDLELSASALSTSTGGLALTLVGTSIINIAASGESTSTGSLAFTIPYAGVFVADALSTSTGSLALTIPQPPATFPGGTWYFEPPIAYDLPPTLPDPKPRYINAHAKWKGGQRRGRSVLKTGFLYTIVDTPTVDQMAAADIVYQGGHIYEISAEEAYYLNAAGFTVYHGTDLLTTEDGDMLTTESGDLLQVEYSFGSS